MEVDLLHPQIEDEKKAHKLKRLIQAPNSYFMDIKCQCGEISIVFSHAQSIITCSACGVILCKPTGGKAKITPGCSFRVRN